jgi:hypothetical protein
MDGRDPRAVRDLLPAVLGELTVPMPGSAAAAATLAFSHLARLCQRGLASEYWVVQKVEEIVIQNDCSPEITGLPLGQLCGLTDEWGAGWGRTRDALTSVVRAACTSHLALTGHR